MINLDEIFNGGALRDHFFTFRYGSVNLTKDVDTNIDIYETLLVSCILSKYEAINSMEANKKSMLKREIQKCLDWIRSTDFYVAPASTIYHDSFTGGLLYHTLKVVQHVQSLLDIPEFKSVNRESAIIVACVHDWCKIGFYESYTKNVKDDITGRWQKVPAYKYSENKMICFGHGVSSLFLAQKFFKLSLEESLAVRWHMGEYNVADNELNELHQANRCYPLVYLIQFADRLACTEYKP